MGCHMMSSFLLTNSIIFQPGEFCDPKSEFHGTGGRLEPHVGSGPALPCQIMSVEDSTGLKGKSAGNQWWVFRTIVTVGFPCFCPSQFREYWLQQWPFNNSKVVMLYVLLWCNSGFFRNRSGKCGSFSERSWAFSSVAIGAVLWLSSGSSCQALVVHESYPAW